MDGSIEGRTACTSGSPAGIGRAMTRTPARAGVGVVINGRTRGRLHGGGVRAAF